jgi:serine/threonine protein kinase
MFRGILCEPPKFPDDTAISPDGKEFIQSLLRKNPVNRLGYEDEQEIFSHPWFSEVDFSVLLSKKVPPLLPKNSNFDFFKMPAMIVPNIEEECSVENFNPLLTKEGLKLSFNINEEGPGAEEEIDLNMFNPLAKNNKRRARLESIDKPVSGFLFLEEDYVETAMFGDMSPTVIPRKHVQIEKTGSALSNFLE